MLKSVEDINTTKKRLKIEIPTDVVEKEIGTSLEKIRQRVKIPGFRQGKAPTNLIEKRFGKDIEAEVLEKIIPEYYTRAMKEAGLKPVAMPMLDEEFDFKRNTPINLSFTVEVMPKIENLNYDNIKVKDIPVVVKESDIEDTIKSLQEKKAVFDVADKEIEMDDLVVFDYVDSEEVGGEVIPSMKELISNMGNEIFPPDIMEKVIGKKKGDVVEFTKTFDQTLAPKEIAGKTVNIKVMIKEVKKKTLPEIDDEFAKDLGFDNMTQLREKLNEKIYNMKQEHARKIQKAEIVNRLIESNTFDAPEILIKKEIESLMVEGNISDTVSKKEDTDENPELDILEEKEGEETEGVKDETEAKREKLEQKAIKKVRASILLDEIGKKEGVVVTDEEINDRVSNIAKRLSSTPEVIRNFLIHREGSLDGLKHSILEEKVMDLLLSRAIIEREENNA